ncbi:PucR family transcriptional regulator [Alicyclobacillus shizuokensis]|uniref:PucR family transcriptional regulator n=1 Tax=Alicyclobacillus shizuokensis TaxID=392014 RepID=UPI000834C997|nr:helix-turn-helix domain-containing protein [Alicyclobacillus shizuokensis]
MVDLQEWAASLNLCILAGRDGIRVPAVDVHLLGPHTEWVLDAQPGEFAGRVVLIPAQVVPGYSSTFDVLVRIFKGAGAAAVVYLGGKRTDFSQGTILLCDNLQLPLLWTANDAAYTDLVRGFYRRLVDAEQRLRTALDAARQRLEKGADSCFHLADWLDLVERELEVVVHLTDGSAAGPQTSRRSSLAAASGDERMSEPAWHTWQNQRLLRVPVRIRTENRLAVWLAPRPGSRLYHADAEDLWVSVLGGVLQARTENFLLSEIPGVTGAFKWTTSLAAAVFALLSSLPAMDFRQPGDVPENKEPAAADSASSPLSAIPEVAAGLSLRRRLSLYGLDVVRHLCILWIALADAKDADRLRQEPFSPLHTPYAYRIFREDTLILRDRVLPLLNHPRYQTGVFGENVCCIPWRDWEAREGVVVLWCGERESTLPSITRIRSLVEQWEARLRVPLRGLCHRFSLGQDPGKDAHAQGQPASQAERHAARLRQVIERLDATYAQFLSLPEGVYGVRDGQQPEDAASMLVFGSGRNASYAQAMQLLQPILSDSHAETLLASLEAYLESGARVQAAADRLFLHRNTLRYRLNRVQELIQADLANPQVRLTYQLALRAWRLHHPRR